MPHRPAARPIYAALLIGGVLLLAAGWQTLGTRAPDTHAYVEGVVGTATRPNPLLARTATASGADADLAALLFAGLTAIGPDGTPLPDLAERWEVTPDGLAYTFHLRPNLRWHDGRPLDAEDIAFTVGVVQTAGAPAGPALAARWSNIAVSVIDARTVTFRLPAASPAFLAQTALGITPRHLLAGFAPARLAEAPREALTTGSGPFRLVSLDAERAVLEPYGDYHHGPPAIERFELRWYADQRALARAVAGGANEVRAALLPESPDADLARAASRPGLRASPLTLAGYTALYMNNRRGILADPALRRALAAAIDRKSAAAPSGLALPGDGPVVPGTWAYAEGVWPPIDQAEALFTAAGWPRGADGTRAKGIARLQLELVTNASREREAVAEAVAGQLRAAGVEVTVRALPAGELLRDRIDPRDYDLLLFGWQSDVDPDPYGAWHTSQVGPGGRNIAGFHDPAADRAMETARATLDTAERREQYAAFSARFIDQVPAVILSYPRRAYVQPAELRGASAGVLFEASDRFRDVYRWRLAPGE